MFVGAVAVVHAPAGPVRRQAGAVLKTTARASSLIVVSGSVVAVATLVADVVHASGAP